jgi:Peptidase MA superfamily
VLPAARAVQAAGPAPVPGWLVRSAPGLRLEYAPQDRALAERLWPGMEADRERVMERLRMFPDATLRVVLAPTTERFDALLGGTPPEDTLGVYLLGQHTIVLRSPRTLPGGDWDLRGVLRHELAHGILDLSIAEPIPLWLNEGLAILVSDELDYLDEAQLTGLAVLDRLIPLPQLFAHFPQGHGARTLAYAQAASFVRFLLREDGMGGLQRLLRAFADGAPTPEAFQRTYGQPLSVLEQRWRQELAARFSTFTLITTTSLLGGLGIPLLLLAVGRRWLQRRQAYRKWEREERLQAAARGEPIPGPSGAPGSSGAGSPDAPPPQHPLRDGWG